MSEGGDTEGKKEERNRESPDVSEKKREKEK